MPGLAAKPIIDMLLVVSDSADEPIYTTDLETAAYVLTIREPGWHEHRMFKGPDTDVHLHVFSSGCPEIGRMLLHDGLRLWRRIPNFTESPLNDGVDNPSSDSAVSCRRRRPPCPDWDPSVRVSPGFGEKSKRYFRVVSAR